MRRYRFYAGLFLLTCSTMMIELVQTRLLSVTAWYHLAFFVISTAMFGMAAGAVWVYLRGRRFTEQTLGHDLALFTAAFAVSVPICLGFQVTISVAAGLSIPDLLWLLEAILFISIPFFFSGVAASAALTRSPYPIGTVYAVDLVGAAAGCLGALALMEWVDAASALLICASMAALGAVFFRQSGPPPSVVPPASRTSVLVSWSGLIVVALAAIAILNTQTWRGIHPRVIKGQIESPNNNLLTRWNSISCVAVKRPPAGQKPPLWGESPKRPREENYRDYLGMRIDGCAGTWLYHFDGDRRDVEFLKYDVANLAYFIRHSGRSAVIGVGGGRDMLSAWLFGFTDVTGVEINPIFVDLLVSNPLIRSYSTMSSLPGMHFIVDEARSWFARSKEEFDLIQMSMIDTWAATGAGAFSLSENTLYTTEAWKIFLSRLRPDGVLTVSRWFSPGEVDETGRMVSLAVSALLDSGFSSPSDHLFVASSEQVATLVLSKSPLSKADIEMLEGVCRDMQYTIRITPDETPASKVLADIVGARDRRQLEASVSELPLNLSPPTDDSPFFFNLLRLGNPASMWRTFVAQRGQVYGPVVGNLQASLMLIMVIGVCLVLVVITIIWPLRSTARGGDRRLIVGGTLYFVLLGMGFMMGEIGLLQRLTMFLGHPIYSLSIVLFSLILTTGVGSYWSARWPLARMRRFVLWACLLGAYWVMLPLWLPKLTHAFDSADILWRAVLSVAAIAPAGFLMGFGFPTGMRFVERVDRRPTPWFWGMNGAAGVLASTLAIGISIGYGINVTLSLAGVCYVALIAAVMVLRTPNQAGLDAARGR